MQGKTIGYWIATALLVAPFGAGGVADILYVEPVAEAFGQLGYPPYAATIIGVAKLIGLSIVLAPRLPRLKEWAYAGFAIDVIGAFWSHAAVGHGVADLIPPVVVLGLTLASWWLRPASRRLAE